MCLFAMKNRRPSIVLTVVPAILYQLWLQIIS